MDTRIRQDVLHEQAVSVQQQFPELYCYLKARDDILQRAIRQVPSQADIELYAAPGTRRRLEALLRNLDPGIDTLAH